ncbi:patatin-like phospholipase family protein [Kutzneria chonburiensis]|uniref:Patatin-like phospholipase family protein n=1 Tax=Kutzneria chonburiensis TaxID=1483604 RepID=A0ABV6MRV6_9PSEU|nr:patatin-like phospholipase family protein [Kutzneria chonburiensis]
MNALVLGGGGPVGASWTASLLHGLMAAGVPVADSDVVVGTSAGSVVGAWLTMQPDGVGSIPGLMRERAAWHAGNATAGRRDNSLMRQLVGQPGQGAELSRKLGQAAIAAIPPISVDEAETLWKAFLPEGPWSPRLRAVAVNADTGLAHAWSSEDGISVPVAVSCSTAAPGAAPPVSVAGGVWVDGGVRSGANADLVTEFTEPGRVLVVAPMATDDLSSQEATLAERGYDVRVIVAERFYQAPTDLLDPGFIDVAVDTGASQAREVAESLRTWWQD